MKEKYSFRNLPAYGCVRLEAHRWRANHCSRRVTVQRVTTDLHVALEASEETDVKGSHPPGPTWLMFPFAGIGFPTGPSCDAQMRSWI